MLITISGTTKEVVELEKSLACLYKKEAALTFVCGHLANQKTLSTLSSIILNVVYFSDETNYSSMIEGIKSGKRPKHISKHNDVDHLEQLLKSVDTKAPKIIAIESVYSMDGDIAPLEAICDLADQHNAKASVEHLKSSNIEREKQKQVVEKVKKLNEKYRN